MAPGVRRLLLLAGLLGAARGLRVIHSPDFSCSQPGINCTVRDSDGLDISWLTRVDWTPTAPASLEVTAEIGLNETGYRVPVLRAEWTVSVDSSIRNLQGAEVSVLELSSGRNLYVQFKFDNKFGSQRDRDQQPWKFFYNKFEVFPGNEYLVSVQHLPKESNINRREQRLTAPGCSENGMMETWTCCKEGYCWSPNINLEFSGEELIVTFSPRSDALRYGVLVNIRSMKIMRSAEVALLQGATAEQVKVIIPNPVPYEPCWYNVSVWPHMENCYTDCVRQWYAPKCPPPPTPAPLTSAPPTLVYVWLIVAAVTVVVFGGLIIFLWQFRDCIYPSGKALHLQAPAAPTPPRPLEKQKIWLVYSADHELYVNVVVRLVDFLRLAWGLDVVLDRHQSQMIGIQGAMAWLGHQKAEIERANGTILILCSKGVQAKWRAMQSGQEKRVSLPEDAAYSFGDLFTPALANILPDFQRANPYDRYLVAYFSDLSDFGDIPSPLQICPQYALIENLEHLLFRIQRIESHQPNFQYNVDVAGHPSYRYLVKAVEQCRTWQETHPDWLGREYIPARAEEEQPLMEEEVGPELTRKVYPRLLQPETSVSFVAPHIIEPEPLRSVNPSLLVGFSDAYMVPRINQEPSPVSFVQPSINTEALVASYRQEPFLVNVDMSVPLNDPRLDLSIPTDQEGPMEDVGEAQRRFLCQSLFDQYDDPEVVFHAQDPRLSPSVVLERSLLDSLRQVDLSILSDHGGLSESLGVQSESLGVQSESLGVQSESLGEAQKRFLLQSDFVDVPGAVFDPLVDEDIYDDAYESDQDVDPNDLMKAQHKFLLQTILGDQHVDPDFVVGREWPIPVYERRPLLEDTNKPLPTGGECSLTYPSEPTDLGGTQVLGDRRMSPQLDDVHEECGDHYLLARQTDKKRCRYEDLGYETMNPNNVEAV